MRGKAGSPLREIKIAVLCQCESSFIVNPYIATHTEIAGQAFILGAHRTICYRPEQTKNSLI